MDHWKERDEEESKAGQAALARDLHVDIRPAMQLGDENLGALAIRSANSIAQPREMHAGPGSEKDASLQAGPVERAASKHPSINVIGEPCAGLRARLIGWLESSPWIGREILVDRTCSTLTPLHA